MAPEIKNWPARCGQYYFTVSMEYFTSSLIESVNPSVRRAWLSLDPRFSGSGDATLASGGTVAQNPPASEDAGFIPGREEPLEREMASRSSILAWEIPLTEGPGGLQSTGSQRVSSA